MKKLLILVFTILFVNVVNGQLTRHFKKYLTKRKIDQLDEFFEKNDYAKIERRTLPNYLYGFPACNFVVWIYPNSNEIVYVFKTLGDDQRFYQQIVYVCNALLILGVPMRYIDKKRYLIFFQSQEELEVIVVFIEGKI